MRKVRKSIIVSNKQNIFKCALLSHFRWKLDLKMSCSKYVFWPHWLFTGNGPSIPLSYSIDPSHGHLENILSTGTNTFSDYISFYVFQLFPRVTFYAQGIVGLEGQTMQTQTGGSLHRPAFIVLSYLTCCIVRTGQLHIENGCNINIFTIWNLYSEPFIYFFSSKPQLSQGYFSLDKHFIGHQGQIGRQ